MKNKRFNLTMLAAVTLQSLAVLIGVAVYFLQGYLKSMEPINIEGRVFPNSLITMLIMLMIYSGALSLMQNYKGSSARTIGNILIAAICVYNILQAYVARIILIFTSRQGAEMLAAKNILDSVISWFVTPFTGVAFILTIVAIARFGAENYNETGV